MSHDTEAAYASSEVADMIMLNQAHYFGTMGGTTQWSLSAMREGGHQWPLADGVILAENTSVPTDIRIAFEYKRPNEGVHGILTALGQSFAYLEKGYDASVMVIPESYSSHTSPGDHIKRIIDSTSPDSPISIYTYSTPNLSATRPFMGHMRCVRDISLPTCRRTATAGATTTTGSVSTLWAHMREGMSHPDAFFRYCQSVKAVTSLGENLDNIRIPQPLIDAVRRIDHNADVFKYLSNTPGDSVADLAWRHVWFNFYFWNDLMPIYASTTPYVVNDVTTKIRIDDTGRWQQLFSGRDDSIKSKMVNKLNAGEITEEEAWETFARKVRSDSHSYREVIDSGLFHIGFLNPEGTLSELGYKYVDACERTNNPYSGVPMDILKASVLQNGQYGALLHYIYKLSEEKFSSDLFAFAAPDRHSQYVFNPADYLDWLNGVLTNDLHLAKRSTLRAGGTRRPLQAELMYLKKLGFVKTRNRRTGYRVGVGLEIDWPQVENSMMFFQGL